MEVYDARKTDILDLDLGEVPLVPKVEIRIL